MSWWSTRYVRPENGGIPRQIPLAVAVQERGKIEGILSVCSKCSMSHDFTPDDCMFPMGERGLGRGRIMAGACIHRRELFLPGSNCM